MRAIRISFGVTLLAMLLGCGGTASTSGQADVRAISAVTNPALIDVFSDLGQIADDLSPGEGAAYIEQPAAFVSVSVRNAANSQIILTGNLNAQPGGRYTLIPHQTGTTATALIALQDNAANPPAGEFNLRIVHVERFLDSIDVYYVNAGTDLSTATPVATNLDFQGATGYIQLPAGVEKEIVITDAGTTTVLSDSLITTHPVGSSRTVLVFEDGGTQLGLYSD